MCDPTGNMWKCSVTCVTQLGICGSVLHSVDLPLEISCSVQHCVGLPLEISCSVHHSVGLPLEISCSVQHSVGLPLEISCSVQHSVGLPLEISCSVQHCVGLLLSRWGSRLSRRSLLPIRLDRGMIPGSSAQDLNTLPRSDRRGLCSPPTTRHSIGRVVCGWLSATTIL